MSKQSNRGLHAGLAAVICFAAGMCLWLAQQWSNTLLDLAASQLLEQERDYLAGAMRHSTLQPSRDYFTLHLAPMPSELTVLAHDSAVWRLATTEQSSVRYATRLLPNTDAQVHESTSVSWIELDLDAALPLADFLRLLHWLAGGLVLVLTSVSLALLYRLALAQQQLHSAWVRERDFVNDVSHELRTPLAIVHNALTPLANGAINADALAIARRASSALAEQLQVLLALARNQQTPSTAQPILPVLEQVLLTLYQTDAEFVSRVSIAVPEETHVCANLQLLQLLLFNIISNACYHGNGAELNIVGDKQRITFGNAIVALDSNITATRQHQGFGHGQSLIRRIAAELGWTLTVAQSQTHYQLTIDF